MENSAEKIRRNIESFDYECITLEEGKAYIESIIDKTAKTLDISLSVAKLLLIQTNWNEDELAKEYKTNKDLFLDSKGIKPLKILLPMNRTDSRASSVNSLEELSYSIHLKSAKKILNEDISRNLTKKLLCNVCLQSFFPNNLKALSCEHYYCNECWKHYLQFNIISNGMASNIECMSTECHIIVPDDFVNSLFSSTFIKEKYDQLSFRDCIESNPLIRSCIGTNCSVMIKSKECKAKRVICKNCNSSYCFKCGYEYHAPTDCKTIKLWLTKCADDSETANYISVHTKDCPTCGACIEKNGGCNHMKCYSCKYEFCWMCLGNWKTHGSQFYDCSKYRENPNIANENEKAREALKKYLFYYERWDNHMRSLRLEDKALERIKEIINEKVMSNDGTWIDWQYLLDASALLAKCRYSLQYTYPYAYFMDHDANKGLFEYQQATLEAEIENLSWKIEHAETTSRGEIENQMDIVSKRRTTLLEDFFL
ncbi:hypothetical protein RDWZM_008083 [Blomia tropicalis]|uniref:RBR-type E3 ubiquitin transferase n=1 Tax=Blomia tropicalis TaxID=40697 RepID=A0A9Q0RL28_BLOTA|nr:E3 ubiquitin-protein ligase arih2 [Blomia tropicalis]KAJ6216926.1 hypothetical protein RDWZM_008083 [Blomia tropicalis]